MACSERDFEGDKIPGFQKSFKSNVKKVQSEENGVRVLRNENNVWR